MGRLGEGIDGHSCVWRCGYGLKMEGLKLMFIDEGGFADLTTSQKILFCKNLTEEISSFSPFSSSFVSKELKLWSFKALIQERWHKHTIPWQYFEEISI